MRFQKFIMNLDVGNLSNIILPEEINHYQLLVFQAVRLPGIYGETFYYTGLLCQSHLSESHNHWSNGCISMVRPALSHFRRLGTIRFGLGRNLPLSGFEHIYYNKNQVLFKDFQGIFSTFLRTKDVLAIALPKGFTFRS